MTRWRVVAVIAAALTAGAVVLAADPAGSGLYPPCPFLALTGLYCPGCGSLRASRQLLLGNAAGALMLNPLFVLVLPFLAYWALSVAVEGMAGRRLLPRPFLPAASIWALLAVVLVYWGLRNLPLHPFTLLAPEVGMNEQDTIPRSPELMSADDTALLVVDVQEKLLPFIRDRARVVFNIRRLIDGARLLDLPVIGTEQYPGGLGRTVPELAELLGPLPEKLTFSCAACGELFGPLVEKGVTKILVTGIEAHVCVQQTVFDLLGAGWRIYLAVDAVGSRNAWDYRTALARMDSGGAVLTTTEAALFEWCRIAGTEQFKAISRLVREEPPQQES